MLYILEIFRPKRIKSIKNLNSLSSAHFHHYFWILLHEAVHEQKQVLPALNIDVPPDVIVKVGNR